LEDIANIGQRPKFEEYETGFFIVVHAFHYKVLERSFQTEQISFFVGKNFLVSFQEDSDDIFAHIREQIKNGKEKIRQRNSDFLAYILIDFIVDHYLEALDLIEDRLEKLETEVTSHPSPRQKSEMYHLKRELNMFKKNVFLLREAVGRWLRADSEIIANSTDVFLRDLLDHINLTLERAENYREMIIELQGLYTAELQSKANSVINVLTIISSIFIPLTFIVGIYGMNFENMPELKCEYGYYYTMGFMTIMAISMLILFRHKKWL
jgi:magnesium transporter